MNLEKLGKEMAKTKKWTEFSWWAKRNVAIAVVLVSLCCRVMVFFENSLVFACKEKTTRGSESVILDFRCWDRQGIKYELIYGSENVAKVVGCDEVKFQSRSSIIIPEKVSYEGIEYTVIGIGKKAFGADGQKCFSCLMDVTFPKSLRNIESYAFTGCTNLEKLDLRHCISLKNIGDWAFAAHWDYGQNKYISNLRTVMLPKSLRNIGCSAFAGCINLGSLDLSCCKNLESIGNAAFAAHWNSAKNEYISNLRKVILPESLITVENFAFEGCINLESVNLEDCVNLKSIGRKAFYNCENLRGELNFTKCVCLEDIGSSAFECCGCLTSLVVPKSMKNMGYDSFYRCNALEFIVVNGGLLLDICKCGILGEYCRIEYGNIYGELEQTQFVSEKGKAKDPGEFDEFLQNKIWVNLEEGENFNFDTEVTEDIILVTQR